MDGVITDNNNCVSTGGEKSLDGGVKSWFVDNGDRVIWSKRGSRVINVWDEYVDMLASIRSFLFDGEFVEGSRYNRGNGYKDVKYGINKYVRDVYGCGFDRTYNEVHGRSIGIRVTATEIYNALIGYYGIDTMDWGYLFRGVSIFSTDNNDILEYIAKDTLVKGGIYEYFIKTYNLRVSGIVYDDKGDRKVTKLDWDGGSRAIDLSELVVNKRHAWKVNMTKYPERSGIRDYDRFLDGRDEGVVMPDRCPIFGNIVLNYTGIDFSGGRKNKKLCSNAVYKDSTELVWSFASVDRIDSNKGYTYDNIKVISDFANGLKNCYGEYHCERVLEYIRSTRKA